MSKKFVRGAVESSTIVIIILAVALVMMGSFGIWSYIKYSEAQTNYDSKVELAVSEAKRDQKEQDDKDYAEKAKDPNLEFNAPEDLGRVRFRYPRTWSSYVGSDGSNGKDYFAYFHPVTVPPVPANSQAFQRFALWIGIYNQPFDQVKATYDRAIEKGELSSEPAVANGNNALKLEGLFPNDKNPKERARGVAYLFRVNDKTLVVRTDTDTTFRKDFDNIIQTVKFN